MKALRIASVALASAILGSCRGATQASLIVRTNVPFERGLSSAIFVATPEQIRNAGAVASTSDPWNASGTIGTLTIVPRDSAAASFATSVVMSFNRDPGSCTQADFANCFIVRRRLSFLEHDLLTLPVVLWAACEGVFCDDANTCNRFGMCVSARIDPATCVGERGCPLDGDPGANEPLTPGIRGARNDAGPDARMESESDAATNRPLRTTLAANEPCSSDNYTCAVMESGDVKCWGNGSVGRGLGDTNARGSAPSHMGTNLPRLSLPGPALSVAVGCAHSCALLTDGSVHCWGDAFSGKLGLGDTTSRTTPSATTVVDLDAKATAISASSGATCASLESGAVKCWGSYYESGTGDGVSHGQAANQMGANLLPIDLEGRRVTQLSGGQVHTCALSETRELRCWGNSGVALGYGDTLGRGTRANEMGANLPAVDLGAVPPARVGVGGLISCAILEGGSVKCWGDGASYGLGNGQTAAIGDAMNEMGSNLLPISLPAGRAAVSVGVASQRACVILDDGSVLCWGINDHGERGLGNHVTTSALPSTLTPIVFSKRAVSLAVGPRHTCALLEDGTLRCWGRNDDGALGLGDTMDRGDDPNEMGDATLTVDLGGKVALP